MHILRNDPSRRPRRSHALALCERLESRHLLSAVPALVASAKAAVAPVQASVGRGIQNAPFVLELTTATTDATIRYTLDGSPPTPDHGTTYTGPITVDQTTVLRAGGFLDDAAPSAVTTWTYLFLDDVIHQSADGRAPAGWPATWGLHTVDYGMDPRIAAGRAYGNARLVAALQAIPSIALTTDLSNLFDPNSGIYANPAQEGRDWERPVSVELLQPDGSSSFQIDAGLRIRGNASAALENPKHSFRLFFRKDYGASTLDFPLFGDEGVDSFKKLDLRTAQNGSWSFFGDPDSNFIAEVFSRDAMRELGQPYTRSRFYHLYLNGQYWGLYQTEERPDADFAASYFGGKAGNYDVVKPENFAIEATDGDLEAWRRLWQAAVAPGGFASNTAYYQVQGKRADGSDDPGADVLLEVDNLIDYMLAIMYAGNTDGPVVKSGDHWVINNFFAIRDRTGRQGFQFIMRDAEHSLVGPGTNVVKSLPLSADFEQFNPRFLHQQLMANPTYRQAFAAEASRVLGPGGVFSPRRARVLFQSRADEIAGSVAAESARWGDAKRPSSPLTPQHWRSAVTRVTNRFIPQRTAIVIGQLRAVGLWPKPVRSTTS
jgi:hypothetical protein